MSHPTGLVSIQFAYVLNHFGFPQRMRLGDYALHPITERLVKCVKVSKEPAIVDPPMLRVPSQEEAAEFVKTLPPAKIVEMRAMLI